MPQFMGVLWMHMCNCACCTCTCTLPVARRKRPHAHRARKSQVMRFFSGAVVCRRYWRPAAATYGSVWSAAFQPCKGRANILNGGKCKRFPSNSVSEWCGDAVTAIAPIDGCNKSNRARQHLSRFMRKMREIVQNALQVSDFRGNPANAVSD